MKCINRLSIIILLCLASLLSACGNVDIAMPFSMFKNTYLSDESVFIDSDGDKLSGFFSDIAVPNGENNIDFTLDEDEAGILVNITDNELLFSQASLDKFFPASITKILTALVVLKHCNLDESVTVTSEVNNIPFDDAVVMGLNPGDILSVDSLLKYMLINSYNDAAIALACHVSGSEEEFAKLCNEEAYNLGATHTHFVNSNGLPDDNHYTCVHDLYIIFNECLKFEEFKNIISMSDYESDYKDLNGEEVTSYAKTTNLYLSSKYDSPSNVTIIGGKTGSTDEAGFCLILLSQDSMGKEYISVILNAGSRDELYSQMNDLLEDISK